MPSQGRIHIPKRLIERSNIAAEEMIAVTIEGDEIVLYPSMCDGCDRKILGFRRLDAKNGFFIPAKWNINPKEIIVYLQDGKIRIRKKIW